MAQKKITDLQLRANFDATCNLPTDDTAQTWRVTGQQVLDYIRSTVEPGITAQSSNYAILTTDRIITMNASGGSRNVTLPSAATLSGRKFTIKKIDSSANAVQILTTSGQTIDGNASGALYLKYQFSAIAVVSDGSNWIIADMTNGFNSSVPTGSIQMFGGATAPTGWLLCDGSAISRTTYAGLFDVLGTTYGSGDGSTTFNLPDSRGVFIRGAGSQTISSIGYTGTRGTVQGDQMQGHYHSTTIPVYQTGVTGPNVAAGHGTLDNNYAVSTGNPITNGSNGTPRIGSETRPANITLSYIIKT